MTADPDDAVAAAACGSRYPVGRRRSSTHRAVRYVPFVCVWCSRATAVGDSWTTIYSIRTDVSENRFRSYVIPQ